MKGKRRKEYTDVGYKTDDQMNDANKYPIGRGEIEEKQQNTIKVIVYLSSI